MIKLIVSDIDGTLLEEGSYSLPTLVGETIEIMIDKGYQFSVATGRAYNEHLEIMFENYLDHMYFITDNGATTYHKNDLIHVSDIDHATLEHFLNHATIMPNCEIFVSNLDSSYIPEGHENLKRLCTQEGGGGGNLNIIHDLKQLTGPITKMGLYVTDSNIHHHTDYFLNQWKADVDISISGEDWILFTNANKGKSIKNTFKSNNYKPEEIIVFGDNFNDINMLDLTPYSFAMEGAHSQVKNKANYICTNVCTVLRDLAKHGIDGLSKYKKRSS